MQPISESYKGYKLICTPQPLADGRFGANLFIEQDLRSGMDVTRVVLPEAVFNTEEEAATVSRIAGRQWVDERG